MDARQNSLSQPIDCEAPSLVRVIACNLDKTCGLVGYRPISGSDYQPLENHQGSGASRNARVVC